MEKLQNELDGAGDAEDFAVLQRLPHLNGVVNEILRLHPAVPTGGLRETPPGGAVVCGRYVPGNTVICAPRYTLGRRKCFHDYELLSVKCGNSLIRSIVESCFERPADFVPERWYSAPDMVKNKNAFAPFSLGTPLQTPPPGPGRHRPPAPSPIFPALALT